MSERPKPEDITKLSQFYANEWGEVVFGQVTVTTDLDTGELVLQLDHQCDAWVIGTPGDAYKLVVDIEGASRWVCNIEYDVPVAGFEERGA